jgi:hypothetical protein
LGQDPQYERSKLWTTALTSGYKTTSYRKQILLVFIHT